MEVAASLRQLGLDGDADPHGPGPLRPARVARAERASCSPSTASTASRSCSRRRSPASAATTGSSTSRPRAASASPPTSPSSASGVIPNVDFLDGSGLALDNGVVVNERFETSAPGVYAAGDVANFFDPLFDRQRRIEHWSNANYQGTEVGKILAGQGDGYDTVSSFFSEVFGITRQGVRRRQPLRRADHRGHARVGTARQLRRRRPPRRRAHRRPERGGRGARQRADRGAGAATGAPRRPRRQRERIDEPPPPALAARPERLDRLPLARPARLGRARPSRPRRRRRRRHLQPDHLREGALARATPTTRSSPRRRRRRQARLPRAGDARRRQRLRPAAAGLGADRRRATATSRSRSTRTSPTTREATIEEATQLHEAIAKPNLLVKIPATDAGARRDRGDDRPRPLDQRHPDLLAHPPPPGDRGLPRGLERLVAAGGDPSRVHSVASFFVSRVDTETDRRLDETRPRRPQGPPRHRQRQARLPAVQGAVRAASAGMRWPHAARRSSAASGRRHRRRTRACATRSTSRS